MDSRATAIIAVPHQASGDTGSMLLHSLNRTMAQCAEADLDVLVVAPQAVLSARHDWWQSSCASVASLPPSSDRQLLVSALRVGVQMSPKACGWFLIPADILMRKPSTLLALNDALRHHLIVHATVRQHPRMPVGFDRELFSELIHLDSDHALHRLMNRYPTQPVEVDDPGLLMHPWHPEPALTQPQGSTRRHPDA